MGISPSTVSRSLANAPSISTELRQAVQELACKRHFKPRVVSKRVVNICALVQQYTGHPMDFSPHLASVLEGISQYVREEKLEMSLYAGSVYELNAVDLVRELRKRLVDGAMVVRANDTSEYFDAMIKQNFLFCCAMVDDGKPGRPTIHVSEQHVSQQAIEHLIQLGHRYIGVGIFPPGGATGRRRYQGYLDAMNKAGIPATSDLVFEGDASVNGLDVGRLTLSRLLEQCPRMTAVYVMGHDVLMGLMHEAYRRGIRIPQDLSVMSCDDFRETPYLTPPISLVDAPYSHVGFMAARQVHRFIREVDDMQTWEPLTLHASLILRESTAPPRKQ